MLNYFKKTILQNFEVKEDDQKLEAVKVPLTIYNKFKDSIFKKDKIDHECDDAIL